ncbi:MAG TPA: UvrD-helicase domain-containing protein, partial [Thermodesulfobacteriota bacterium]|nr:UvrD-helicase domain-containing protein [Thermodesulfobacteriota bacterium]
MPLDLNHLNPFQREAVTAPDGPSLIIAGPGTGKTLTLAYRIAYLISELEINPEKILAVTFTTKAAQEMRERVINIVRTQEVRHVGASRSEGGIAPEDSEPTICTFHALGLALIREEGEQICIPPDFRILSEPEQIELVKEVLSEIMPEEPQPKAKQWARKISEQKNLNFDPPLIPAPFLSAYENRLRGLNLLDFDDLILHPLLLFRSNPQIKAKYQNRFTHLLVDEYQDLNLLQYLLLKELSGPGTNVWVVGDADQAIYAFRGANVEYFLRFQQDNPQAHLICLEKNYRSTEPILSSALAVIKNNPNRFPYNIFPANSEGHPLYFFLASDNYAEANLVVKEIEKLVGGTRMESRWEESGMFGFSDIAILYRLHQLSFPLVEALQKSGIPYQVVGGRSDQVDSIASYLMPFLKLVLNPHDDLSLRVIAPHQNEQSNVHTMLRARINRYQKKSSSVSLGALIKNIAQELKIKDKDRSAWLTLVEPFQDGRADQQLPHFLEYLSLLKEGETYNPKAEAVTLMTVHAAKGLEFPVVFIVGLESGIFPCTEFGKEQSDIEEERRLFYVGMTRAKQRLYLSCANERFLYGENRKQPPSPFISEIPRETIKNISERRKPVKPKV